MKKISTISVLLLLFIFMQSGKAQNPCSGTPGSNYVIPLTQTVCAGQPLNMTLANSYSTSGITYQWQTSTISIVGPYTPVSGATLHAYNSPSLSMNTFFNVIITCTNSGLSISVPYSVTVIPCNTPCSGTPAATSILPNSTVCIGSPAALNLSTTYTETGITYQWSNGGATGTSFTSVPGATLSSFITPTLTASNFYQVVITCTNTGGTYTTTQLVSAVSCTFCSGPPPSNSIAPLNPSVCAGGTASLGLVTTYSVGGYTYQWQSGTTSVVGPFVNLSGATNSVYVTPPLNTTTYYNIVITCTNGGQNISLTTPVTVSNCSVPCTGMPSQTNITPLSSTICSGNPVTLGLTTSYNQTGIAYQWFSATSAAGPYTQIAGANQSTYNTPNLTANAFYSVVITCTNSGLSVSMTRSIAVVTCTSCSGAPGSNTIVPVTSSVCASTPFTLSLAAPYLVSGYTYQWQSSTVSAVGPFSSISNATANIYVSPGITQTTYYNLIVTCPGSGQNITLTQVVYTMACAPPCNGAPASNTILPVNATVCPGAALSLGLANSYTNSGLTYQWYSSTVSAGPYSPISAATGTAYSHPGSNVTTYYQLVVSCGSSSSTFSRVVTVTPCITPCQGPPQSNTLLPLSATVCAGSQVTLSLAATFTSSGLIFQWSTSTVAAGPFNNIAGATGTMVTYPSLAQSMYFRLTVTCPQTGFSNIYTTLVTATPCPVQCSANPASNTVMPLNQTVCVNAAASMSLSYTYTDTGISYQWEGSSSAGGPFTLIPGANAPSYTSPALQATSYYNAIITCTNSNLLTRASHTVTVKKCDVGIREVNSALEELRLFPNPNNGLFEISGMGTGPGIILVTDLSGRMLYTAETSERSFSMDLRTLKSGTYLVELKTPSGSKVLRLVKE